MFHKLHDRPLSYIVAFNFLSDFLIPHFTRQKTRREITDGKWQTCLGAVRVLMATAFSRKPCPDVQEYFFGSHEG